MELPRGLVRLEGGAGEATSRLLPRLLDDDDEICARCVEAVVGGGCAGFSFLLRIFLVEVGAVCEEPGERELEDGAVSVGATSAGGT